MATDTISYDTQSSSPPSKGKLVNLVVMIKWVNHVDRTDLPPVSQLEELFNHQGPTINNPTGSVRDYMLKNSQGQLTINSIFTDWIQSSYDEDYVSHISPIYLQNALIDALKIIENMNFNLNNPGLDVNNDSVVDLITFVHSGYAGEFGGVDKYGRVYTQRVWSHRSPFIQPYYSMYNSSVTAGSYVIASAFWNTTGTSVCRIGVLCHELIHQFGLPDLYDTNGDNMGYGSGLGNYCLMGNLWGVDLSQLYPPSLSAWVRIQLGWVTPIIINSSNTYTIESNVVYMISQGYPSGEYLLIENRPAIDYDSKLPGGGGIAIYHIDENTESWDHQGAPPNINGWPWNHYRVALLQADGRYDLELTNIRGDSGDLYKPGQSLTPFTVPDTNTYQYGLVHSTQLYIDIVSPNSFKVYWNNTTTTPTLPTPTPTTSTIFYTPTTTITVVPTTVTVRLTTTTVLATTITLRPTTTTVLPTTITLRPTTTTVLPTTITLRPTTTTVLSTTITLRPTKTLILPTTITLRPTKTVILPATTITTRITTVLPTTITLRPTKTVILPTTTITIRPTTTITAKPTIT